MGLKPYSHCMCLYVCGFSVRNTDHYYTLHRYTVCTSVYTRLWQTLIITGYIMQVYRCTVF